MMLFSLIRMAGDPGTAAARPLIENCPPFGRSRSRKRRHQSDASGCGLQPARLPPVRRRRDTDAAPERVAEAAEAGESDRQASVSDGAPIAEQPPRPLEARVDAEL